VSFIIPNMRVHSSCDWIKSRTFNDLDTQIQGLSRTNLFSRTFKALNLEEKIQGLSRMRGNPGHKTMAPERMWKWGGGSHKWNKCLSTEKNFVLPSTFLAIQVQLVVLVSAFVMVTTVWSVSCLLFFHSRCPRVPSHL